MRIALGYCYYAQSIAFSLERAFEALGHTTVYVGLPANGRLGHENAEPLPAIVGALSEKPDIFLWVDPASRYFPRGIEDLAMPTAAYFVDVHLGHWREQAAKFFDAVFIAQRDYVDPFKRAVGHEQVYWMPLAAAPDVHYDHHLARDIDVGFVGNLSIAHQRTARARRLGLIAKRFRTNDFYRSYTPADVGEVYSRSKIVFNTSIAGDVTMRLFEGTASGALMLTDAAQNGLDTLFRPDQEIVIYADDGDLLNKIDYYLEHTQDRERIALAGQIRTNSEHTYSRRVGDLLERLGQRSFSHRAPMRTASPRQRFEARRVVYTHLQMLDMFFDDARATGLHPARRLIMSLPCLARRVLL